MTHNDQAPASRRPTEAEAYRAAGQVYGAILADPDRRAALLAHRAATQAAAKRSDEEEA